MSRCFPYPPPGYTLSGARNEALIESIKLQKEKEKERKEKKERRKEKKEKRKERKERRKEKKHKTIQNVGESDVQKLHVTKDKSGIPKDDLGQKSSSDLLQKKRETENNQLEQSSLTEEHARPVTLYVPSSSSESTENSKKRKRLSPPEDDTCSNGQVILIRLPSTKQNELDALVKEQQQPCSTSGRIDSPSKIDHVKDWPESFPNGTRSNGRDLNAKNGGENVCLTSLQKCDKIGHKAKPESVLSSMQKMDMQYQNLFKNLLPPQVEETWLCSDSLDWLLEGNNQRGQELRAEKKPCYENVSLSCSRSSVSWPRVEYLPEVDVYALPFTVPY
ncbi:Unknown protein [Striga hermonthica]|uniref:Uncharacterized protein n=1 Tax=Striga hermonthica TaxID=68872 RepID=A0A9N7MXX5_STRHE|nr:Unknown protein [Striga hermonthica]